MPAATVADLALPYSARLIAPRRDAESCRTCLGPIYDSHRECFACARNRRRFAASGADAIAVVSLARSGSRFASDLYTYKRTGVPAALRRSRSGLLAALLFMWRSEHERCLAAAAGTGAFDVVTIVPSSRGRRGAHPLRDVVGGRVAGSGPRCADLLSPHPGTPAGAFRADPKAAGLRVLLVDDTWTTGQRAQAASAALHDAGAQRVGLVVLGRWVCPEFRDNDAWLAQRPAWSWRRCTAHPIG